MQRREFIVLSSGALWVSAERLWADHHLISGDPLIVTFDLGSLKARYTDPEDFYIRNHHAVPENAPVQALRIEGEVERPQELTPHDLSRLSEREIGAVLECAGDPATTLSLVSDGLWKGWPLGAVLALAQPRSGGTHVHLFGQDGFSRSVPIDRASNDGILVTRLNGRPLPRNHGAPWRVLFPGWYAMDSVKWLKRIVVAPSPLAPEGNTYLELRKNTAGAVEAGPLPRIRVKSVITLPADRAVLRRGRVEVRGLAWSGSARVSTVQLSADGGARWKDATLDNAGTAFDWTLWRASVELHQMGPVELVCRASDARGNTQPERRDPQRMDDYAYNVYHRVRCVVI